MNRRIASVAFCLLAVVPVHSVWACSFCLPDPGTSLLRQLDSANAVVVAELVDSKQHAKHPVSRYRIASVLKGASEVDASAVIDVPLYVQAPPGTMHLFFRNSDSGQWGNPRGVSAGARRFLSLSAKLPAIDKDSPLDDRVQRLAFLLPHLRSADREIARSAYAEFAVAPDAAVKALKPILNHRELIAWLELDSLGAQGRRLTFTLLRVTNRQEALPVVRNALNNRLVDSNGRTDLDSIIAAYLTLAGPSALDEIERRIIRPADVPLDVRRAAANALRFHVDSETVLDRQRVIASCRLLLADPKTADFVIGDLARWEDWASLDAILKLRAQADDKRWLLRPTLEYLEACPLPAARSALAAKK